MRPVHLAILVAIIAGLFFGLGVFAGQEDGSAPRGTVPMQIPYQGVLEKNGLLVNAIGEDRVTFRVSLYDAPVAGNKVWPASPDVYDEHLANVYNGRFALAIGSNPAIPYQHIENTPLYLDIQVMGPDDSVFVPLSARQRLLATPFAVAADRSDTDFSVNGDLQVSGAVAGPLAVNNGLDVTGTTGLDELTVDNNVAVGGDLTVTGGISGPVLMHDSSPDLQGAGVTCPAGKKILWAMGWVNDNDHPCDSENRDNRCSKPVFLMSCAGQNSCSHTGNAGGCSNPGPTCIYAVCH